MCYIICMCVCVGASDSTTVSNDPNLFWSLFHVHQEISWGTGLAPLVTRNVRGRAPKFVFGWFFLF
jgi:hypothetical protein